MELLKAVSRHDANIIFNGASQAVSDIVSRHQYMHKYIQ